MLKCKRCGDEIRTVNPAHHRCVKAPLNTNKSMGNNDLKKNITDFDLTK